MLAAAIGAIDGQAAALEAVLADIEEQGIQTILTTGNYAVGSGNARNVVARVRGLGLVAVQGAADRQLVRFRRKERGLRARLDEAQAAAMEAAYTALPSVDLEWLRSLPRTRIETIEELRIAVCHGTLTNSAEILDLETPDYVFERQREIEPADIIVAGGASAFHSRTIGGTLFVCCGPLAPTPNEAAWALIDTEDTPFSAREIRVPLD